MAALGVAAEGTGKSTSLRTRRLQAEDSKLVKDIEASYVKHITPFRQAKWKKDIPPGFNPVPLVYHADNDENPRELKVQANRVLLGVFRGFRKLQKSPATWLANADMLEKEGLKSLKPEDWQDLLEYVLDLHLLDEKVAHELSLQLSAQNSLQDFLETERFQLLPFFVKLLFASVDPFVAPAHTQTAEANKEPQGDISGGGLKGPGGGPAAESAGEVSKDTSVTNGGFDRASRTLDHHSAPAEGLPKENQSPPADSIGVGVDEAVNREHSADAFGGLSRQLNPPGVLHGGPAGHPAQSANAQEGELGQPTPQEAFPSTSTGQPTLPSDGRTSPVWQPPPEETPLNASGEQSAPPPTMRGGETGQPTTQGGPPGASTGQFVYSQDARHSPTGQPTQEGAPPETATGQSAFPQHIGDGRTGQPTSQGFPPGSPTGQSAVPPSACAARTGQLTPQGAPLGGTTGQSVRPQDTHGGRTEQPTREGSPSSRATGQSGLSQDACGGGRAHRTPEDASSAETEQLLFPQSKQSTPGGRPTSQGVPLGALSGQSAPTLDGHGGRTQPPKTGGGAPDAATGQSTKPQAGPPSTGGSAPGNSNEQSARSQDEHHNAQGGHASPQEHSQGPPLHEAQGADKSASPLTFDSMLDPGWSPSHGFPQGLNPVDDELPQEEGQGVFGVSANLPPTAPGAQAEQPFVEMNQGPAGQDGRMGSAADIVGVKRKGDYGKTIQPCLGCDMPGHIRGACKHCGLTREDAKRLKWEKKAAELEQKYKGVPYRRSAQTDFNSACQKLLNLKMKHQERVEFVLLALSADGKGNPSKTPMVFATGPPGKAFLGHAAAVKLWASTAETHFLELKKIAEETAVQAASKTDVGATGEDCSDQAAQVGGMVSKEVVKWLEDQQMAQYVEVFRDYHWFKMDDLKEMTVDGLSEMGVKGLHKQRLLKALNNLHIN
ncbi:hypothetical protein KFL_005390100 [Klebsormidium nitens]|uniref:SAM domain-containing protein n=1 Tax=Klebsormidium nitens TaxID=105231 RepID=A0A1Y1IFE0_KLENI|nr:hypothetical protein KFL_005390100 [Klebsormidium nitens]|eukprot:GAQ89590.1 hypothetical protein KFL_005390100 [Klebsormidium nitens]